MITRAIFQWAKQQPDKVALVYGGRGLTYADFAVNIAVARGYFVRRGCTGPGVAVLAAPHLRDFWVLSLALRSLGVTTMVVPDAAAAIAELELPDLRWAVTTGSTVWPNLAQTCAAKGLPLLTVSLGGEAPLGIDDGPGHPPGGHILRTSGTTGTYKKVLMDPAFEAAFGEDRRALLGVGRDSVVTSFHFAAWGGVGYNSPVSTWFAGATAVIDQRAEQHLVLRQPGLTHALLTPALLADILAAPEDAFPRNERLHLSITSGTVTQAQIDAAKARITPIVFNRVGSTEVNTFANTALETPEDHRWHRVVREIQIVDAFNRPTPLGEVGRLRVSTVRGPSGYMHDAEATARFFQDGFFYPGDLAIMREDGRIALQGRVTDVINVGGHKISPAPIEDRLREAFAVSGVCLTSIQNDDGEEQIHVLIEASAPVDVQRLATALRAELSTFSSAHVHFVPNLPRNEMGKLMRAAARDLAVAAEARA